MPFFQARAAFSCAAAFALAWIAASCAPSAHQLAGAPTVPDAAQARADSGTTTTPIKHVIIMIQENRSFDDFFAGFPGADGATSGKMHDGTTVPLSEQSLAATDMNHDYTSYLTDYDHGKMDGFNLETFDTGSFAGTYPYQYVNPAQIAPYWGLAKRYALADHMFSTQGSSSFTAHQDLIAGGTVIAPDRAIIDIPVQIGQPNTQPWGCDAPSGTVTSLVTQDGILMANKGPFPCFSYKTLRDTLDAKGVSWKYFVPPLCCNTGPIWNAFDAISAVRNGPEWTTNISTPETTVFNALKHGKLAAVNWVIPDGFNSDHPQAGEDTGPSWVASVVNKVGASQYWKSTAIVILWDDWGGFYDHVPPKVLDYGGLGFRVPMILVSPYAKPGYISHTGYEFGSILKFVEENWGLSSLGTSDVRAASIADMFDFTQKVRAYVPIAAKYPASRFENEKPSYTPVDDQ